MNEDYLYADAPFAHFTRRTFLGVLLTAIVTGIVTLILTLAIEKVVLQPALCSGDAAMCSQSGVIAFHIASVISAIIAVVMLVQASVFRPLLIVLAVTISLWNIYSAFLYDAPWVLQLLILVLLNILAYFAFSWILRMYNFTIALIASIVLIVLTVLVTTL